MPIYEFRCLKCREITEILFRSAKDEVEMKCRQCGGEELERVLSSTSYTKGASSARSAGPVSTTRTCGSGTCGTIEIPGHDD
ncbi:MAG: zinc ribbon domain-containing protein [Thermodesulfobacteriota bacterium]